MPVEHDDEETAPAEIGLEQLERERDREWKKEREKKRASALKAVCSLPRPYLQR